MLEYCYGQDLEKLYSSLFLEERAPWLIRIYVTADKYDVMDLKEGTEGWFANAWVGETGAKVHNSVYLAFQQMYKLPTGVADKIRITLHDRTRDVIFRVLESHAGMRDLLDTNHAFARDVAELHFTKRHGIDMDRFRCSTCKTVFHIHKPGQNANRAAYACPYCGSHKPEFEGITRGLRSKESDSS